MCPADVTDEDAVRAAVEAAVAAVRPARRRRARRADHGLRPIEDVPREVYEAVVDTAVHGTANVARVVLPVFRKQGGGHLVVVNSLLGSVTAPLMGSYVTAKWGQLGLIRVLQQETRDEPGISISAVQPGGVDTPIYFQGASWTGSTGRPPPPVYSPQRVARIVLSTLDRPRRMVQAGVFNPLITAGFRLLPGVYDLLVGPLLQRHGDRQRRRAADRRQRVRSRTRRATPPRGTGAASRRSPRLSRATCRTRRRGPGRVSPPTPRR